MTVTLSLDIYTLVVQLISFDQKQAGPSVCYGAKGGRRWIYGGSGIFLQNIARTAHSFVARRRALRLFKWKLVRKFAS